MADTAKRLSGPTQLTTSAVTQLTATAAVTTIIRNIHCVNGNASARTLTLSIGTDGTTTRFLDAYNILGNDAYDWSGFLVLAAGEIIQAKAGSATSLVLTISGIETS